MSEAHIYIMSASTGGEGGSELSREQFLLLREEIQHEDDQINQRSSWLVSAQSFLLTGFAITLNRPMLSRFPDFDRLSDALANVLPVAGALSCLLNCVTVWAALIHMR